MLAEQVYQDVREDIISSRYPPGAMLVEKEIAGEYGVSRGTAREALQRLSAEGRLTNLPRKGYQVSLLTRDDIEKIQRLRLSVESLALSVVIDLATDEQLRAFFPLLLSPPGEGGEYTTMNARFHLELAKLTGDPFIVGTLRSLLGALTTTQFYHQMGTAYDGQEYHEGILTALLRRDYLSAVECLKKDLFR
jgi:DNA-binding GntR family transcriptional regulator